MHEPQRSAPGFPWPLVDRVLEVEAGVRAVGTKRVSVNEPYFAGHFPGAPVLLANLLVARVVAELCGT